MAKVNRSSDPTRTQKTKDDVASDVPPALRKECSKLKRLISAAERGDVERRFEIASIVKRIKNGGSKYGDKPLSVLEREFGFDEKSMYRWAHVVDVWPTVASLNGVLSKTNARGLPLTWSHLELLADLDGRRRDRFVRRALDEALSVRALRAAIDAENSVPAEASDVTASTNSPTARFEKLVAQLDHAAAVAAGWQDLIKEGANLPSCPEVIASLEHARAVSKRVQDVAADIQAKLEIELQRHVTTAAPIMAATTLPMSTATAH